MTDLMGANNVGEEGKSVEQMFIFLRLGNYLIQNDVKRQGRGEEEGRTLCKRGMQSLVRTSIAVGSR